MSPAAEGSGAQSPDASPSFTVVVPLYNEAGSIGTLLGSLAAQLLQPSEVIFVDAGSSDSTRELLAGFRAPFAFRVLRCGRLHPGEARNEGVRAATSEWIAFTDGGIELTAEWLLELDRSARSTGASVVFGSYDPTCDTLFRRCAALAYVPARGPDGTRGPTTASLAAQRELILGMGGFPEFRAAEDLIFFERLEETRAPAVYAPRARVVWQIAADVTATFRRFRAYSAANLVAQRARYWHLGVARQYLALGAIAAGLAATGHVALSAASAAVWIVARASTAALRKRGSLPFETLNPVYVLGAAGLLLVLDTATVAGTVDWLRAKERPRRAASGPTRGE